MTVENQFPYQSYIANGTQTDFSLSFYVEDKSNFVVKKNGSVVSINDYTYTTSNTIRFNTAPKTGDIVEVERKTISERAINYATYNNTFRPETLNHDLDRLWRKIQELGVVDWLLDNKITELRNYVDHQDDELRSYLLEEIRKQGVALDQLDEYYNYLMQRLAQIAVDKGWDASFVVDGDRNQHQINTSFYSNSLTDYKTISELKEAELTLRTVNVSGSLYEWQPDNSTAIDDVYFVQSNLTPKGRWVNLNRSIKSSIKTDLVGIFRGYRKLELTDLYNVGDTLPLGQDYLKAEGYGEATGFTWTGGDGTQLDLARLKPILAVKKASIDNAVSGIKLIDFCVDMNDAKNICAVDSRYITNNSKVEGIRVKNIGINSVGYYISKQWYARFTDCYALGRWQNEKEGVGIYVDTRSPPTGTINQVNSITLDISCRDLKVGYLIDPSRYIYSLIIPDGVTIEKCGIGIKVTKPDLPVTVRNGRISAYFEKNDLDVEWGDITDTRALDEKITWINCSFEDADSHVILNRGQHTFIGCTGLNRLTVNNASKVKLDNTYVDIIENNTGDSRSVLNLYDPNVVAGSSQYGSIYARPLKSETYSATLTSGNGANPVTFPLYVQGALGSSVQARGQKARIFAFARRSQDTTTAQMWSGTLVRLSGASYLIPDAGTWSITASIDNAGVLTLSSAGSDTKYYDVTVTAM